MTAYKTLLIDPPWKKETGGGAKYKRGADRHYDLAPTRNLPGIIKESGNWTPHRNAHVWLWTTNACLPDALWLMAQLGATYKTNVAWCKTADPDTVFGHAIKGLSAGSGIAQVLNGLRAALTLQIGLGQYLRGSHELLLFGVIGAGMAEETWRGFRDVRSVIRARRTKHSRKPEESYALIERVSHGPRMEFFATKPREGWDQWGDQMPL